MKVHQCEQYSPEWYAIRLGKPTASMFHKIVTPTGQMSKQSATYMYKLLAERLLNETMTNQLAYVEWAERGKIKEPQASAQLEFTHGMKLEKVGFVMTNDERLGCSPDYVYADRAVEIKCPAPWTQLQYLDEGLGNDYVPQVQGQLLIGEWDKVHLYSWHPNMPPVDRLTGRNEHYIRILRSALERFLDDMELRYERLRSLGAYVRSPTVLTPLERTYPEARTMPLQIEVPDDGQ